MRRLVAGLVVAAALVGCGQGALLSRSDAIGKLSHEKGLSHVSRREAKLMLWTDFLKASQVQANPQDAPPFKQRVWVVAVSGDVQAGPQGAHQHWALYVYNAVSGAAIGHLPGPFDNTTGDAVGPDWPPTWQEFPDSG
jgi:hypothetical protein